MTFGQSILRRVRNVIGDRQIVTGKIHGGGSGTGNLDTGLAIVENLQFQGTAGTATSQTWVLGEDMVPGGIAGTAVLVYGPAGSGAIWKAYGR